MIPSKGHFVNNRTRSDEIKGIKALALDSTYVKVHPDGTGASKKGLQSISKSRAGYHKTNTGISFSFFGSTMKVLSFLTVYCRAEADDPCRTQSRLR